MSTAEPIPRQFRWSWEWTTQNRHFAIWVPWRHAGRPLVYRWWAKTADRWVRLK